jgi:hypothetical protein
MKHLEENTGISLHFLEFGNRFLDMTPKTQAQATKENNRRILNYIKIINIKQ